MPKQIEIGFDLLYLLTVVGLGLYFLLSAQNDTVTMWGVMALVLGGGDAFHLVPRMAAAATGDRQRYLPAMNTGKMITSITMTVFYLFLWQIGLRIFSLQLFPCSMVVYLLAAARIVLCLFPRSQWTEPLPPLRQKIYRNIPFVLIGCMVLALYAVYAGGAYASLRWMWLAVLLSFLFYIPVVLLADKYPRLGMLMLPKSCVYIWIVAMGLG